MAHLWILDDSNEWTPQPLVGDAGALIDGQLVVNDAWHAGARSETLLRRLAEPPSTWAVLSASPALRLNGAPVPLGLALLDDRDEIRLASRTVWFSTETLAHVEPFPETAGRGFCPRCRQPIEIGCPAVRCPSCGLWHHAADEFPCWTYAPACAACDQETALNAGFRWTPEDL